MTIERDCNTCKYERTSSDDEPCDACNDFCNWTSREEHAPSDAVNHPQHYASGKIECIDAIEVAIEGLTGLEALCTGNIIKYLWRWKKKNGIEDLKKAKWYLEKLITTLEGGQ